MPYDLNGGTMYYGYGIQRFKVKKFLVCSRCNKTLEEGKFAFSFYCQHEGSYTALYFCKDCIQSSDKKAFEFHDLCGEAYEYKIKGMVFSKVKKDFAKKAPKKQELPTIVVEQKL